MGDKTKEKTFSFRGMKDLSGFLADKDFKNLFILDAVYGFAHFVFMIEFHIFGVSEMVLYNLFSVTYFVALALMMRFMKKVNYNVIDTLQMVEIVIHQILAIYFVGFGAGFEYILLGLSTPLITFSSKQYKNNNYIKCFVAVGIFCACKVLSAFGVLTPVYSVDRVLMNVSSVVITLSTFFIVTKMTLSSYSKLEADVTRQRTEMLKEREKLIKTQNDIINSVANLIESRDESTGVHTMRTSRYTELIAKKLAESDKYKGVITEDYLKHITMAAALHDVGKIKTPDSILNKPGRLTQEEFEIIKKHTADGGEVILKIFSDIENEAYVRMAYDIAMYHHERFDGKGYLAHLCGTQIPLSARIVAVCDVYDALTSERCYKEAYDVETAVNIIVEERGKQFDPDVVDAFLEIRPFF